MGVESDLLPANGPEADSSKTTLPDHKTHLAKGRISQFERRTPSRRSLLRLAVLGAAGIASGGVAYALFPRGDASAAIAPPTLETKKGPLNLTAPEVFGGNVTTEQELRSTPDEVLDYQLVINEQGKVSEVVVLSKKDNGIDTAVTRMILNPVTGKFDKGFQTTKESLAIDPYAVYKSGQRILVGGRSNGTIAILESKDDGRTFTAKNLPFSDDRIRKFNPIPGSNKLFVTTWNLLSIYDPDQDTTIPTITGGREDVSISAVTANTRTVTLYSEIDNKLSKDVINIDTGQVISSEIVSQGTRVYAHALIKDSSGNVNGEVTNDHINTILTINLKGSKRTLEYKDWLNHLNIPNFMKDNLFFTSISVLNDTIWAVGGNPSSIDGLERAIAISFPLNSDPSTNKDVLTTYIIGGNNFSIARRMEWGIFGLDLPAFLIRVENMGLVSIETKADGSPADNKAVTYLAIKDQTAPLYRISLPLTTKNYSP